MVRFLWTSKENEQYPQHKKYTFSTPKPQTGFLHLQQIQFKTTFTMKTEKPKHIGRNISRLRELRGMKQEALAMAIGVTQQTVSHMENSATVDDDKLVEVAKALNVSVEAIKNFSDEMIISYINNFNDNSTGQGFGPDAFKHCTFNPLDKLMEMVEVNQKLYERLVESEREKVLMLKKENEK